jgi:hypothetical protein
MKKFLKITLASLTLVAAGVAHAALPVPQTATFDVLSSANAVSFSNLYDITVQADGTNKLKLVITGANSAFSNIGYELFSSPMLTVSGSGANNGGVLTAGFLDSKNTDVSLTGGSTYALRVFGTKDAGFGFGTKSIVSVTATYGTLTPVTPVPEPETYAMLLAGLGLMGTIVRRRKTAISA